MNNEDVRNLNFSGWPLPDEYLIELGRVSALWGSLESFLNICIGKLAGFHELHDPKPFILITHASVPQRLDMFGALCEHLVAELPHLAAYKQVIGALRTAQKSRNNFMHHGMAVNPESGAVDMAIGSARGTLKVSVEKVDIADIRRATMDIDEAQTVLYRLVLRRDLQPVWRRRAAEQGATGGAPPPARP
jgi:hypothetical protein